MISFKFRLKNKQCAPPKSCRICKVPLCFHRTLRFRSLGSKDGGGVPLRGVPPVLSLDCVATGSWCRIQGFFQQCGSVPKFGVLKIHALLLVMPTCFGRCAFIVFGNRGVQMLKGLRNTWEDSTGVARMEGNCDVTCFFLQQSLSVFHHFLNAHEVITRHLFSSSSRFSKKKAKNISNIPTSFLSEGSVKPHGSKPG